MFSSSCNFLLLLSCPIRYTLPFTDLVLKNMYNYIINFLLHASCIPHLMIRCISTLKPGKIAKYPTNYPTNTILELHDFLYASCMMLMMTVLQCCMKISLMKISSQRCTMIYGKIFHF